MKITKSLIVNKNADDVWKIIGHDFDQAHLWMDPIPESYAIGRGEGLSNAPMEGRICHLSDNPQGAKAKEVITQFSEEKKQLTFEVTSINVPAIIPLKKNVVQMTVKDLGMNKSEVVWVSRPQLKPFAYLIYPMLRLVLPVAFGKLLKGLKVYAEGSAQQSASASN